MAIPLPNLDTRTWTDLAEEGRAVIPVAAPRWTDHNVHDPGITLIELMAWVVEAAIFRLNTVPERHIRKFLALCGFTPYYPIPARVVVGLSPDGGTSLGPVPPGTHLSGLLASGELLRASTLRAVHAVPIALQTAYAFDGESWVRRTDAAAFPPFGDEPIASADDEMSSALYLGFVAAGSGPPPGPPERGWNLSLFVHVAGSDLDELTEIAEENASAAEDCGRPAWVCEGPAPGQVVARPSARGPRRSTTARDAHLHHDVRTVWEWRAHDGWRVIPDVEDQTRGLSSSGFVRFVFPDPPAPYRLPEDEIDGFYVRCRLVEGRFDATPIVQSVVLNAVMTRQSVPHVDRIPIAPGSVAPAAIAAGAVTRLAISLDGAGVARGLIEVGDGPPQVRVLSYQPPTTVTEGELLSTTVRLDSDHGASGLVGTGMPDQAGTVPAAPVASGTGRFWGTAPDGESFRWDAVEALDAADDRDRWVRFNHETGRATFGSGVRAVALPRDESPFASYRTTKGSGGNIPTNATWELRADDWNQALLGPAVGALSGIVGRNLSPGFGGADAESIASAARRAAAFLWAHERLVDLADRHRSSTLDGIERTQVLELEGPPRAVTSLDFERLALAVPGTRVLRSRAWAGHDARLGSCLEAPGTVTVAIVPGLPRGRPVPTRALLDRVHAYLYRRRVIGTRLHVTGPEYVDLHIDVRVQTHVGADSDAVVRRVEEALRTRLHPLRGGRRGRGWPFGRDIHAPELLGLIDGLEGVDFVQELTLRVEGHADSCDRVCLPQTGLPAIAHLSVEVGSQ